MKKEFAKGFVSAFLLMGLIGTAAATTGRQTVEVDYNDIDVQLNGSAVALVDANGKAVEPFAIDGTTYLPVRAVATALGLDVGWVQATTTVTLDTPEDQKPIYITKSGSRYHYDSTCNGGTYYEIPFKSAVNMGYGPCDKCVNKVVAVVPVNNNIPFSQITN